MGQYREARKMEAYIAGSDNFLVQLKMDQEEERILVFDQNGYIRCDDDSQANKEIIVLRRDGGKIIKHSTLTAEGGRFFLIEFKDDRLVRLRCDMDNKLEGFSILNKKNNLHKKVKQVLLQDQLFLEGEIDQECIDSFDQNEDEETFLSHEGKVIILASAVCKNLTTSTGTEDEQKSQESAEFGRVLIVQL